MAIPAVDNSKMATYLVSFQSDGWQLNGCVHLPQCETRERIGVIILAEVTKFGTHGLHRKIAEGFAASGFYALRFDNRGTFDSPGICDLAFDDRVADAIAAVEFFRTECKLDKVFLWGICLGSALAVHAAARLSGPAKPAGLILCTLLANPAYASLPEFKYRPLTFSAYLRNGLTGSPWNRLRAFVTDEVYRANLLESIAGMARSYYSRGNGRLQNMQTQIGRVGPLLAQYEGPSLLIHADTDAYWLSFKKDINPGDHLKLSRKKLPPRIEVLPGADRMYRSVQDRAEVIRLSVSWAVALRDGQHRAPDPDEIYAVFQ